MKPKIILAAAFVVIGAAAITKFSFFGEAKAQTAEKMMAKKNPMEGWSKASMMAAEMMKKKYGEPAEASATMMVWNNTGQWKRTIIYAKEFKHDFPMPHTDVMEQCIDYKVPPEKFTDLGMYDGSVGFSRTNGELSARCDKEGANFLAVNLANDVITGKKDVKTARDFYATSIKEFINGGKPDYMEKLHFSVAKGNTADSDQPSSIITQEDMMKAKKMMEMMQKEMGMDGKVGSK